MFVAFKETKIIYSQNKIVLYKKTRDHLTSTSEFYLNLAFTTNTRKIIENISDEKRIPYMKVFLNLSLD